ncbi:MAG: DNA/RNA nuclease SfsA [Vampirovibrionales bacterium]
MISDETTSALWLPFPWEPLPLLPARFVARPNRFIGVFCWDDDPTTTFQAHIADPGRLQELLLPNARVWVVDHGPNTHRKLRYTMPLVESPEGQVVSIFSRLPNAVFIQALKSGLLEFFRGYTLVKTEPRDPHSTHRFDALLRSPRHHNPVWVEVKGASLVENALALFPDAVTTRGTRQLKALTTLAQQGHEAWVVFIVQRPDATAFAPHEQRDPDFARALHQAHQQGVRVLPIAITLQPGRGVQLQKVLPVHWVGL